MTIRTICLASLALASILPAQSLTTTFADNNGRSVTPPVNLFDVTVLRPGGLRVVALDVNSMAAATTVIEIDVYFTPNTYVGVEQNAAAWVKVSSGRGIAAGRSQPTAIDVADFTLPPGTNGLGIHFKNGGSAYTNGTGTNQNYGNADLTLQLGSVSGAFFTGGILTPRVWNGTIHYHAGNATFGTYADGCVGSNNQTPTLGAVASSRPQLGTTLSLSVTNLPSIPTPGTMLFGIRKDTVLGLPLPLDLAPLGAPGCRLALDPMLTFGLVGTSGSAPFALPIPNNPTLTGFAFYLQAAVVDGPANTLGLTFSNGGEAIVGT
jgi:hypothetical protein